MAKLLTEVRDCAQHSSGRHPDANVFRHCSSASETRSATPRVCRNVGRLRSGQTPATEGVILAAVEGDTGEIHAILHEHLEYCNQGPGCRPTSWRPVGYVITTFRGKCCCFQEAGLYFSRVTARLGCFHHLVSDVILQ